MELDRLNIGFRISCGLKWLPNLLIIFKIENFFSNALRHYLVTASVEAIALSYFAG